MVEASRFHRATLKLDKEECARIMVASERASRALIAPQPQFLTAPRMRAGDGNSMPLKQLLERNAPPRRVRAVIAYLMKSLIDLRRGRR